MASSSEHRVIVLGCKHGGLATIRALGRKNITVIAVTDDPGEFGLASKYIQESAICPHPADDVAFKEFMLAHADRWQGALVLETNDYYAVAIAEHKAALAEHYRLITPDREITQLFIEKDRTYALADEVGVPYPALVRADETADLESLIAGMSFPMMVKPVKSHEFVQAFGEKLFIVDDLAELRELFERIRAARQEVMIQEIIPGTDDGTLQSIELYIDTQGIVRGELYNVKIRQTPPMWGVMRVGMSVPPIADIREYAIRMLTKIDYRGFASFEFKRDPRDGIPKLIEVNVRQPRNAQMIIASGVNLPWLIFQDIMLNTPETVENYTPTYYIDLIPDIGNSLLREPRKLLNLPYFLKPYLDRNKTYAVLDWDDMKPFQFEVGAKFGKLKRMFRR